MAGSANKANKANKKPAQAAHGARTHQVRIIGGQWKRTPLTVLDAEGLRPTPDRVRETVFNWLNHFFDGAWERVACLDLFAGSGALGFEAASRGAARVVMVESNAAAVRQLQAMQEKLKAEQVVVMRGDAVAAAQSLSSGAAEVARNGNRFNLIFLDPPYHQDWLAKMLPICDGLLVEGGLLYAEAEQAFDNEALPEWLKKGPNEWEVVRAGKAGMVFYHLLQRKIGTSN
ncbi:MAG: 16S rRNA (guanine(966)-N(2))-methyltransferase RsmD [Burkholderiaceae bacterium]|nr:16S rRNA (guanine(966)-N(2))-methyltransferase RsmD [Burkholderiaceae bacterium]